MKKIIIALALLSLTACTSRVADLTVASTKNINMNGSNHIEGQRVTGTDSVAMIILPLGQASVKEAIDKAIETDRCAVGLTDAVVDQTFFYLYLGFIKYTVEGNLIIDKDKSGCENWVRPPLKPKKEVKSFDHDTHER